MNYFFSNIDENVIISFLVSTCSKTKDIIEQENDKKKLRDIIENIKQIKKRLSFKKSPDEIYDEIEMWISSNSTEEFDAIKEYQDDSILKEEEIYNENQENRIDSILFGKEEYYKNI